MDSQRIFVVEDESIVATDIEDCLKLIGHHVAGRAASGEDAVRQIADTLPNLVLMDIMLSGEMDGIEAAEQVRQQFDIPVVFLTSHGDSSTLRWACISEPFGYILKPFDERELRITIEMALYRHKTEKKLRQMERWLTTTLKSIGDGVIATDTKGGITFMNPAAEQLTGWEASDAKGRNLAEVFRASNAMTGQLIPSVVEAVLRHGLVINVDPHTRLSTRDGREICIDDSAAPIRDTDGVMTGVVLAFRDCSARLRAEEEIRQLNVQLEKRVELRTAELASANKELESFSYSIAHDLRAPLRAINGFAQMLAEQYAAQLDDEARRLISVVCENALRMGQMVEDFLNLARIGRQALRTRPVFMTELVNSVLAELDPQTRFPTAVIELEPLPDADGDPSLLRQVWINLLANALKFSGQNPSARIVVGARPDRDGTVYFVKDNGVGFNPQYAGKLFGVFQRLHSVDQFEGTGVGLAITHRIIERHGGRIWAESAVNQGATFYFTVAASSKLNGTPGLPSASVQISGK